jgi:uncharacterized protein (DUF302 family)
MSYGTSLTMAAPFGEVVVAVRAALATQGFGVLTEIDVQATLKAKIDADMAPYLILGACHPPLAHRALLADPSLGLLLPCNVVVRQTDEGTVVEAVDPMMMVTVSDNPALAPVADEAASRLRAALAALAPLPTA